MFKDELKKFVEDNPKLVSMKPAGDGIFVLKYKKSVFYDNLWNDYLEECRGTIVDADFNIVTYPFTKIYNYGVEARAPKFDDDTKVTAFRKVNGFMVAMTVHNGELLVSTTGSTDSEFVTMAKEMMVTHMPLAEWKTALSKSDTSEFTFMFECVHPKDPHIIPEKAGMYLIGYRANEWRSKVKPDPFILITLADSLFKCHKVPSMTTNMIRLQELAKEVHHEGFVFYDVDGRAAKIKSPYYLVKKFVARNPRTDKLMRPDVKQSLDEEYYPLIDAIQADIEAYTALDEQARLAWVRKFLGDA